MKKSPPISLGSQLLAGSLLLLLSATSGVRAADGTWNVNSNGTWGTSTNWADGVVAGGADSTAYFNTFDITATRTITNDENVTLGHLVANDTASTYNSFLFSGSGTITMDATSGSAPSISIDNSGVAMANVLAGNDGLIKKGSGTLEFRKASTYTGNTTIAAGTIKLSVDNAIDDNSVLVFEAGTAPSKIYTLNGKSDTIGGLSSAGGGGRIVQNAAASTTSVLGLNVASGTTYTFDGVLKDQAGVLAITKTGAGTQVFSGGDANVTYTGTTTVNEGVLEFAGATVNNSSVVNITGSNAVFRISTTADMTRSGVITGAGSFEKAGGTAVLTTSLTLSGSNSYTGKTILTNGNILLGANDVIPDASVVEFSFDSPNARLRTLGFNETIGGLHVLGGTGTRVVENLSSTTNSTLTLNVAEGATYTYDAYLRNGSTGTLSIVKDGLGTQVFSGANVTYSGTTTVNAGVLEFAGATVNNNSVVNVSGSNALFRIRNDATLTRSVAILGAGGFEKLGSGTLTLSSGSNNYTGGTVVSEGSLRGTTNTLKGNILNNANLTFNQTGSGTYSGVVSGSGSLTMQGNAATTTVTLSGNNSYKGATEVLAGRLIINGNQSGATGAVTVSAGATLGGSGTIGGATTISGTHSPGNSPGLQTFNSDLTYSAGASVLWELAADTTSGRGTSFDGINVAGALAFSGTTTLTLSFNDAGSTVDWTDSIWDASITGTSGWLLFSGATSLSGFSNLQIANADWLDGNSVAFLTANPGSYFTLFQDGNDVYLNYVIPEPSSVSLVLGGFGMLLAFQRLRRRMGVR